MNHMCVPAPVAQDNNSIPSNIPGNKNLRVQPLFIPDITKELPKLPPADLHKDGEVEPRKVAINGSKWSAILHCLPHTIPLTVTITILCLNFFGVYWQDLGHSDQSPILQALQYVAKAHELMIVASLTVIVVHRIQSSLNSSQGVPFGFLTAGFRLTEPSLLFTKEFFGGATAHVRSRGRSRFLPLGCLLVLSITLTSVVGPSSAVAMIPRLDWWDVPKITAFGPFYNDRIYLNWTEAELWPSEINNAIYADLVPCTATGTNQDCAVRAMDPLNGWVGSHQVQGTKPNVTIFQDLEVTRFLTSQGGPPDNSSWTITSTVGSLFARDLAHYWDWLVENSTISKNIEWPLLRPAFQGSTFKMKKPLVQTQCQTYFNPDWEYGIFEFPHDQLLTPPLNEVKNETWTLPNNFILNLKGNDSNLGNINDTSHPWILFDWFDTASNFSNQGAPSLGAVIIYQAFNGSTYIKSLATCSFDGRWAPFQYFLDPKETVTIYQDSPNPMDILNGTNKVATKDLTQMKMTLDWANTMNIPGSPSAPPFDPAATVVEQLIERLGNGSFIYPEPEPTNGYVMKSLDWRLSTTLGLYLTEGLARAFQDRKKGSMLYRQAPSIEQSYIRPLNNINDNDPDHQIGYHNGQIDWVPMKSLQWNASIPPWDVWAPLHGYTEISVTVQRYGYGYGLSGTTIKLATAVLVVHALLVSSYIMLILTSGKTYKGYARISDMLAVAWNSAPVEELRNSSAGIDHLSTWRRVVRVREKRGEGAWSRGGLSGGVARGRGSGESVLELHFVLGGDDDAGPGFKNIGSNRRDP